MRTSLALPLLSHPFFLWSLRGKVSSIVKDTPSPFPTFCRVLSHQLSYLNFTSTSSIFLAHSLFLTNTLKVAHPAKCFHSLTHARLLSQLLPTAIPLGRGENGLRLLIFCYPILSFFYTFYGIIYILFSTLIFFLYLMVLLDLFYQYIKSFLIFYSCTIVQHMFIS